MNKTHGYSKTRVYKAWRAMKNRCTNPNYDFFDRYGGRGITYHPDWESFENFLKDMGEPKGNKNELDRIDNNGNYEPGNCRWVTKKENCNNRTPYKSKTGFTGVVKKNSKYQSIFYVDRKQRYVGVFETPEEAHAARIEAIKKYNEENNANLRVY